MQIFLLCLFSFFVLTTVNAQTLTEEALMARAAKAEGLDKNAAFLHKMEAYKQELAGKYLLDERLINASANAAYSKVSKEGKNKQMLIRQVFHALPQHVMNAELNRWQQRMDSISRAIAQGADFGALVNRYSDIRSTEWVSKWDMMDEMEEVVSNLRKGQISQPFLSPQGIHIIQLLDEKVIDNVAFNANYLQRVKRNAFPNKQAGQQIDKLKKEYAFAQNQQTVNRLYREGKVSGVLFTMDGKSFTGEQFATFAKTYPLSVRRQYEAFVAKCVLDCETKHLDGNAAFTQEVQALSDKLLAQEAYDKHVRVPSHTDEAGLRAYFSSHEKDYRWPMPRFRGAVIHAADKKTAKKVSKVVKKSKNTEWSATEKLLDDKTRRKVFVEQGVFAFGVNAFVDELEFKHGRATPMNNYPVALTVGKKINGPDDYNEVREQLMKDYEQYLSEKWLSALRKQK